MNRSCDGLNGIGFLGPVSTFLLKSSRVNVSGERFLVGAVYLNNTKPISTNKLGRIVEQTHAFLSLWKFRARFWNNDCTCRTNNPSFSRSILDFADFSSSKPIPVPRILDDFSSCFSPVPPRATNKNTSSSVVMLTPYVTIDLLSTSLSSFSNIGVKLEAAPIGSWKLISVPTLLRRLASETLPSTISWRRLSIPVSFISTSTSPSSAPFFADDDKAALALGCFSTVS
mmetsp:Transcript_3947/g.8943  ORF Transcript_3947/g.8943 Transcript_3947/m.8943 type:complete len:228 (+) Transcript_3947:3227-3910(+)